tara:strand:+ start:332 stop:586 length:255 start_codon:yes stop_codon:yes gene_type:complete
MEPLVLTEVPVAVVEVMVRAVQQVALQPKVIQVVEPDTEMMVVMVMETGLLAVVVVLAQQDQMPATRVVLVVQENYSLPLLITE